MECFKCKKEFIIIGDDYGNPHIGICGCPLRTYIKSPRPLSEHNPNCIVISKKKMNNQVREPFKGTETQEITMDEDGKVTKWNGKVEV